MVTTIADAIREGTFPNDEKVLETIVDSKTIPSLLKDIQSAKHELSSSVTSISKDEAKDVDDWIRQAKKVQDDIARCKADARRIVESHEHLESLRAARDEVRTNADLIQDEILFNSTLQQQIKTISETDQALQEVDKDIVGRNIASVSQSLSGLKSTIETIQSSQGQRLLTSLYQARVGSLGNLLDQGLEENCHIATSTNQVELQLRGGYAKQSQALDLDEVVECLDQTGRLQDARFLLSKRLENALLPHLHSRSSSKISKARNIDRSLILELSPATDYTAVVESIKSIFGYLSNGLPQKLSGHVMQHLSTKIFSILVDSWLNPAVPSEIADIQELEQLQQRVESLHTAIQVIQLDEASILRSWLDQLPDAWLNKRRRVSLNAVRRAFQTAKGTTRPVERTETQNVPTQDQAVHQENTDDDWAENWDDEDASPDQHKSQNTTEDDSDAWGFGADAVESKPNVETGKEAEIDDGDAWGWGDEGEPTNKDDTARSELKNASVPISNGITPQKPTERPMVLTEIYHITDIPDYILEQVGKDNADMQLLTDPPSTDRINFLRTSSEISTLPQSTLSMYRAIAPSYYTEGTESMPTLSTMNLYNDSSYLSQKLGEHPELSESLRSEMMALSKFSRQVYTTELSTQRQILSDLMDNAQGFIDCTREPNTSVCETAVASTVDYIRTLHSQWSTILSPSHTAQSIGSLLSSVMSKMIKDIEDIEDISEAQSQKLVTFMENISKTEDLFLLKSDNSSLSEQESVSSLAALHVPAYLRFHYLQQILESSLVDIKYLWTDAGLSIEFSSDEVIDLIKALFAESSHRRNAISTIRG